MVNLDRLLVGGLLSLAAVSYYATAFEISIKLLLIPGALLADFFPAFAAAHTSAPSRAGELYDGMLRSMLLLMFPGTLVFVAFAPEILTHWVGRDVAMNAATVMQILCIGVFINSMGQVSFSALQALGRPDLTAKLHVVELPLYAIAVVLLTREYGLTGVAIAWTARVAADTVLLAWLMRRRVMDGSAITRRGFAYLGILGASVALAALPSSSTMRALVVLTILVVSIPVAWRQGLRQRERELVGSLLGALKWNTQSP
jgi:O-antigen/teichoic acid export membrane protein